jgi:hypothetical protein
MSSQDSEHLTGRTEAGFRVGVDDLVIVPPVAAAFAVWRVLRRTFFILIDIVDFTFPILLQVMRFPLFTLRIAGDGIAALLKGVVRGCARSSATRRSRRPCITPSKSEWRGCFALAGR